MIVSRFEECFIPVPEVGCWLWTKSFTRGSYGQFVISGKHWRANRLAYVLYKGDIPSGLCVLHKCDTPQCVNPDHLFLGTIKDNSRDMVRKGRHRPISLPRETNPNTKLSTANVEEIRSSGDTNKALAKKFGVGATHISAIRRGKSWGYSSQPKRVLRGEQRSTSKLRAEQVREMRKRHANGEAGYALSKEYGICRSAAHGILTGKTWKHLLDTVLTEKVYNSLLKEMESHNA